MVFVLAGIASAVILVTSTPAGAQVPGLADALGFAAAGWGAVILVCIIGYMIGKQQFPDDRGGAILVMMVLGLLFVGLGGMDWWTFGEFQGMPWENAGGEVGRRAPGNRGW